MSTEVSAARAVPSRPREAPRPVMSWIDRVLTAPRRFFGGHDVFISYCRRDGSAYAEALAARLASRKVSCFIDQWLGNPEPRIPAETLRTARWSYELVVLATPGALRSESVEAEVAAFVKGVPGPIQVVEFPGADVTTARWYEPVSGVMRMIEAGGGIPSDAVFGRIVDSLTYWTRNRRIAWTAGFALVLLIVSLLAGWKATEAQRRAAAVSLALRAEDRLANDPSQVAGALRMGVESLRKTPTAWGESVVRKGLMLLPVFRGSVAVEGHEHAVFGPGGVLAQWFRDSARSEATGQNVSRVALIDAEHGTFVRPPVEMAGMVRTVRFAAGGAGIVVGLGAAGFGPLESVYWIPRGGGEPRRFAVGAAGAFALDPAGGSLVVANGAVERWTLGAAPVKTAEWTLPDVQALAFSPDGSRLFALRSDRLLAIDPRDPAAPAVTLAPVADASDPKLLATEGHVVMVLGDSVRTWSLARATWDHAFEGTKIAAVAGDRLAAWTRAGANIWDLAAEASDPSQAIRAGCEGGRGRQAELSDVAVSADGRRAALACEDGTARVVSTSDGTLLAMAPVEGGVPHAVHLDGRGNGLLLYATTSGLTGPRGRIAAWTVVNASSDRIGGSEVLPAADAFALDARGHALAAVLSTPAMEPRLAIYDPLTGRERARADAAPRGTSFRMAFDAGRVALASEREVSLWRVEGGRLRLEGAFPVEEAVHLQFGGQDATHLAISSSVRRDVAEVTVLDRGPGGWRKRAPRRVRSWTLNGRPAPIEMAPAAVSEAGWIAFLADTAGSHGSIVRVERGAGAPLALVHNDAVTQLRFIGPATLLVATHGGEIWAWTLGGPRPKRRLIGRHESPVMALIAGGHGRVLSIDRDNVIRMWAPETSTDEVGLRGYMEFPINRFGMVTYNELGAKALGVSGERLVTINQHPRGLFADSWVIPRESRLQAAVDERLGGAQR